jgi:hypoxanthine phosphoribosyltransferase
VSEIEEALARGKPVLVYTSKRPPRKGAKKQPRELHKLLTKIRRRGIVRSFTDRADFRALLKRDLLLLLGERSNPYEARRFTGRWLSAEELHAAARFLARIIQRSHFRPDLIVAVNQGGLLMSGALTKDLHDVPVGTLFVDQRPLASRASALPELSTRRGRLTRILVVDSKCKTGRSLQFVDRFLRQKYGQSADIQYAIALAYRRWRGPCDRWPVQLAVEPKRGLVLPAYIANYLDPSPRGADPVLEVVRPGAPDLHDAR